MDAIKYKIYWSKKEVQDLFKKYKIKPREDLKDPKDHDTFEYYELPDGKLLLVIGASYGYERGTMYKSEAEYRAVISQPDIRKPDEHMLSDLILDDQKFLQQKDEYIQKLGAKLKLPAKKFNFSLESLTGIDNVYRKRRPSMHEFFREDYLYLIAYLGEVYKKQTGGQWYFEREQGAPSFIPFIKLSNGKKMDLYYGLFKECYEHYENMSINSQAVFELMKVRGK